MDERKGVLFQAATWRRFGVRFLAVEAGVMAVYVPFLGTLALLDTFRGSHGAIEAGPALASIIFVLVMGLFFTPIFALIPALSATAALVGWRALRPTPAPIVAAVFAVGVALFWGMTIALVPQDPSRAGWAPPYLAAYAAVGIFCASAAAIVTRDVSVTLAAGVAGFAVIATPMMYFQPPGSAAHVLPLLGAVFVASVVFQTFERRHAAIAGANSAAG